MKKEKINYSIGLDIGTSSVGWAVTDNNAHLLKKGNRNLWGANLFGEAKTAKARRMSRSSRRRYTRRKNRIALLQELTAEMVNDVDPYFFRRLKCSYMDETDRGSEDNAFLNRKGKKTLPLFGGLENNEINSFYKGYSKTIYHLRKYVMEADYAVDPRLVYLCLHHIIKYRGNFLYEGQQFSLNNAESVLENMSQIMMMLDDITGSNAFSEVSNEKLLAILVNTSIRNIDKKKETAKLMSDKELSKNYGELVKAYLGYTFNFGKLISGIEDKNNLRLSDADSEETEEDILASFPDCDELLQSIKDVCSFVTLSHIMSGNTKGTISDAMISIHEKHKSDLAILKRLIVNNNDKETYKDLFKTKGVKTYENYVHNVKRKKGEKTDQEEFCKAIIERIKNYADDKDKKYVLTEIENGTFLPKCNLATNAAIPYQYNEKELKSILENQGRFYPCLKDNAEKILSILTFRIPYYVGPLVDEKYNPYAWIERKTDEKLYPWNWEKIVDKEVTAERFIRRMTNHCTYLLCEDVIPKKSLLYSRFEVLNELNNVRIDGRKLSVDTKKDLIDNLFMVKTTIKTRDIEKFLVDHQYYRQGDITSITGTQKEDEFASSLSPWIAFRKMYGDDFENNYQQIETIIEWLSVYNDKRIIRERIKKQFPDIKDKLCEEILKKNYKGFGKLSRRLLEGLKDDNYVGSNASVMDVLENTQDNLMKIIGSDEYGYKQMIINANRDTVYESESNDEIVAEMYCSPKIKRGILQSLRIVDEIKDYFGCEPERIYIEMSREEGEKKRTKSRATRLKVIYDSIIKNSQELVEGEKVKKDSEVYKNIDDAKLANEKMLLYVIQNGKCMYSMKTLEINRLSEYEVDHVIPQSYIKDDSIENKVLVISSENQRKTDNMLLESNVISKCRGFWKNLLDNKLIGEKKYYNLIRTKISENEEIGFINRQLVETRQISKNVANILKNKYLTTAVVSVKASLSSEFRHKFDLHKLRILNDVHHAHDAYLATVMGKFILDRYPFMITEMGFNKFSRTGQNAREHLIEAIERINERLKEEKKDKKVNFCSFIVHQMNKKPIQNRNTGEIIWAGEEQLKYIEKIFDYKDYFITYKLEYGQNELYKQTIYSPNDEKTKPSISTKADRPVERYGGYTSANVAYGMAVEILAGKKRKRIVSAIPMSMYNSTVKERVRFIAEENEVEQENITVVKDKILSGQMFITNNSVLCMASPSEWNNARQLFVRRELHKTIYQIEKNMINDINEKTLVDVFEEVLNKMVTQSPIYANQCKKVLENKDKFLHLSKEKKIHQIKEIIASCAAGANSKKIMFDDTLIASRLNRLSKKTINLTDTLFIDQSVSGIYTKTYKL